MDDGQETLARRRFILLNILRFGAIGLVMLGFANSLGKLLPEYSPWLGYALLAIGMAEFFILPGFLSRRWRGEDRA